MRRWIRPRPLDTALPRLSAGTERAQRSLTASPQCQQQQKSTCSSAEFPTKLKTELIQRDAKRHSDFLRFFLYKVFSCNVLLESLWIPGTSISRYSIYRWNYKSKLYRYVKILYVQLNCSMLVHWVCPPVAEWLCSSSFHVLHIMETSSSFQQVSVRKPVWLCLVYLLDCRRLVEHESVPSNFHPPFPSLCTCACIKTKKKM